MGKAAAAWSALHEGGPRELISRTRQWGARALDPASEPGAPEAAPPAPSAPAGKNAANVGFAQATRFFKQRHANYEKLADAIAPHLDPDGVLFDIGANIGYFSMVVGDRTGFRGQAHLFEPIPHLAQFCFRTLTDAEFSVAVHQYGLGDSDGHVDIFIDTQGNFGWNTMIAERASYMTPQRITVRRFDGIGLTVVPSVIKIDVEGAEYLVLRGLLPALRQWDKRPPILCEIGWGAEGHPAWKEELEVFAELEALGYRPTTLEGEPVVLEDIDKTCDVMFLPG
ncbi:MAG: FkbM family methyltransferase [Marmoricola sp.]